jgi:DNA-damage-inducible protein D
MPNLARVDEVVVGMIRRDEEMSEIANSFIRRGEISYVSAVRLGEFLGYKDPHTFLGCVNRAQVSASHAGRSITHEFVKPDLLDPNQNDVWLTHWAAFASIMEADATKPRVAIAKSYFASIVDDEYGDGESRLKERSLFKRAHKDLHGAAERVGVNSSLDHAMFDDAGYRGMYGMPVRQVEKMKQVPSGQRLVDCAGSTEIAANNLRMAMTKDTIDRGDVKSKVEANKAHERAGKVVRKAVLDGTGMTPERLPLAPKSIDELSLGKKRELKSISNQ